MEYYNGQKSLGSYVVLTFSFFAVVFSTSAILTNHVKIARGINALSVIFVGLIWILCAFSIGFAVLNGDICREAVNYKFARWHVPMQKQLNALARYSTNATLYIEELYTVRDFCYNNQSIPFYQMALGYSQEIYPDVSVEAAKTFADGYAITQSLVQSAYEYLSAPSSGLKSDLTNWATSVGNSYATYNRGGQSTNNQVLAWALRYPIKQIVNAANSPTFHLDDPANDLSAVLAAYGMNSMDGTAFSSTPTGSTDACYQDFTDNMLSLIVGQFSGNFTVYQNRIENLKTQLLTQTTQAKLLQDKLRSLQYQYDTTLTYSNLTAFQNLFISNDALGKSREILANLIWNSVANIVSPFARYTSPTNCHDIAEKAFTAEALVCNTLQAGFDSSYWALGALGVFYFIHILTIKLCVTRLYDDPKWLIMAGLLRFSGKEKRDNGDHVRHKVNSTGTTYLEETDFDVRFKPSGPGFFGAPGSGFPGFNGGGR